MWLTRGLIACLLIGLGGLAHWTFAPFFMELRPPATATGTPGEDARFGEKPLSLTMERLPARSRDDGAGIGHQSQTPSQVAKGAGNRARSAPSEADLPAPSSRRDGSSRFTYDPGVITGASSFQPETLAEMRGGAGQPVTMGRAASQNFGRGGFGSEAANTGGPVGTYFISGKVLDQFGNPVPGTGVVARARDVPSTEIGASQIAVTNFDGRYLIAQLAAGTYEVRIADTERYSASPRFVSAGADTADFVLIQLLEVLVYGTVRSTAGKPLTGVKVTFVGQSAQSTQSFDNGSYQLPVTLVDRGDMRQALRFRRDGFRAKEVELQEILVAALPALEIDVELEPLAGAAVVSGRVSTENGAPVGRETVYLSSSRLKRKHTALTDSRGSFSIEGVASGADYSLRVHPKGPYQDYGQQRVEVGAPGLQLDIVLAPLRLGRVSGRVVNIDGDPVPLLDLWVRSGRKSNLTLSAKADGVGYFSVDGVPAGALSFQTRAEPRFHIHGVQFDPEADTEIELVVDSGPYTIQGVVVDLLGAPVAGSQIYLNWSHREHDVTSNASRRAVVDSSGRFGFENLGWGTHRITAKGSGFITTRMEFQVGEGDQEILVQLERELD